MIKKTCKNSAWVAFRHWMQGKHKMVKAHPLAPLFLMRCEACNQEWAEARIY